MGEIEILRGARVCIRWRNYDGGVEGACGVLDSVVTDADGRRVAVLDWGYGVPLDAPGFEMRRDLECR